jgi:amino acid transporter
MACIVFKGSFALVGLADYVFVLYPIPILITAIVSGLILILINYRGARSSGSLQNIIVIFLLMILAIFIIQGSLIVETSNFSPFMPFGPTSIFATTGLIFISYLGITQLAALSEEVKNPAKNLPRAIIASVVTVTLIYTAIMIVISGTLTFEESINTIHHL